MGQYCSTDTVATEREIKQNTRQCWKTGTETFDEQPADIDTRGIIGEIGTMESGKGYFERQTVKHSKVHVTLNDEFDDSRVESSARSDSTNLVSGQCTSSIVADDKVSQKNDLEDELTMTPGDIFYQAIVTLMNKPSSETPSYLTKTVEVKPSDRFFNAVVDHMSNMVVA